MPVSAGTPAEFGPRALAWLIDGVLYLGGLVVARIFNAVNGGLGVIASLALLGFFIWNWVIVQGQTGQTIGKRQQRVRLVKVGTGQPLGPGMAFVRYLVGGLLAAITCGVYGVLDYLWPLWDANKQRLTDKILGNTVVVA